MARSRSRALRGDGDRATHRGSAAFPHALWPGIDFPVVWAFFVGLVFSSLPDPSIGVFPAQAARSRLANGTGREQLHGASTVGRGVPGFGPAFGPPRPSPDKPNPGYDRSLCPGTAEKRTSLGKDFLPPPKIPFAVARAGERASPGLGPALNFWRPTVTGGWAALGEAEPTPPRDTALGGRGAPGALPAAGF